MPKVYVVVDVRHHGKNVTRKTRHWRVNGAIHARETSHPRTACLTATIGAFSLFISIDVNCKLLCDARNRYWKK
uniref:Uncharacterized protein n=1 Tax=Onchocerca volvulus TaxID=6282 RepID=A0A2K6VSR3_ONCVO